MNTDCIISFANHKNRYLQNLARLGESLRNNSEGIDFLAFVGENSLGADHHEINPYSFKINAFDKAFKAGYENVLWVDSSVFAIKQIQPVFDRIKEYGYAMQKAGHWCGNWCSDMVLEYHGITRDDAMLMPMIGNAGMLGLSVKNDVAMIFFDRWAKSMRDGQFIGAWDNKDKSLSKDERCLGARHDMSNSSILINLLGMIGNAYDGDEILQYAGVFDATLNDKIIFKAQG